MDIATYRDILLTQPELGPFSTFSETWDQILLKVENPEEYEFFQQKRWQDSIWIHKRIENHPLVNNGEAYWQNRNTLCIGYSLKSNPTIFRPIFSHARQYIIDKLLPNIPLIVKKRAKALTFMAIFKIKKLPKVIIDEIINLI